MIRINNVKLQLGFTEADVRSVIKKTLKTDKEFEYIFSSCLLMTGGETR